VITLAIAYLPAAKGAFAVAFADPKVKLPAAKPQVSLWFGDENGQLTRNDPRQRELPLRTVPDPQQNAAKVVEDPLRTESRTVNG
jgi:hypothetical protein